MNPLLIVIAALLVITIGLLCYATHLQDEIQKLKERSMAISQDYEKVRNFAANLSAALWDYGGFCPECGNRRENHLPGCAKIYEKKFKGPQDTYSVFDEAFEESFSPTSADF